MTSVFEVPYNKERLVQEEDLLNATDQKHQSAIHTKKEDEPSRKYFMICQTCFWCASYIDILGNMDALPYKACPTCANYYQYRTVNIIVLNIPQPEKLFCNLGEKSHQ